MRPRVDGTGAGEGLAAGQDGRGEKPLPFLRADFQDLPESGEKQEDKKSGELK